jgi:hypothetical protein
MRMTISMGQLFTEVTHLSILYLWSGVEKLKSINARVDQISTRCNDIAKCVEAMEQYSYQFNVKIVGMPLKTENEKKTKKNDG